MDLFKILFKRILYKIPLKLLLIIVIVLMLSLICFNAKIFAYDGAEVIYNNKTFTFYIPDTAWAVVETLPEYTDNEHNFLIYVGGGACSAYFWPSNVELEFYNNISSNMSSNFNRHIPFNDNVVLSEYHFNENGSNVPSSPTSILSGNMYKQSYGIYNQGKIYYYTNANVYTNDTKTDLFYEGFEVGPTYVAPYIVNSTGLTNWSFTNLYISLGSEPYRWTEDGIGYEPTWWTLSFIYNDDVYFIDLTDYIYEQEGIEEVIFRIPRNVLSNYVILRDDSDVTFYINQYNIHLGNTRMKSFLLDSWTLTLTAQEQIDINDDSEKQVLGSIDSGISNMQTTQQETNNKLDNLSNSITDNSYNSSELTNTFSGFGQGIVITDNTHIEELFTMVYNAFCNNSVVALEFDMPFTRSTRFNK